MKEQITKFDLQAAFKALDEIEIPQAKAVKCSHKILKEDLRPIPKTEALLEDYYDVNDNADLEIAQADRAEEVAQAKLAKIEKIVDLDADSPEDLQPSYVGKTIVQCPQCMTLFYREQADLNASEDDEHIVNVGEVCPNCGNDSGYQLVGKVAEVEPEEQAEFNAEVPAEENELNLDFEEPKEEEIPEANSEEEPEEELNLEPVEEPAEENKEEEKPEEEEEKKEEAFEAHSGNILAEQVENALKEDVDHEILKPEKVEKIKKAVPLILDYYDKIKTVSGEIIDIDILTNELFELGIIDEIDTHNYTYDKLIRSLAGWLDEKDIHEALKEDVDELTKKLKEHDEYIKVLQDEIKAEEEAVKNAKNDFIKKMHEKNLEALKDALDKAIPEEVKAEAAIEELPTAEDAAQDMTKNEALKENIEYRECEPGKGCVKELEKEFPNAHYIDGKALSADKEIKIPEDKKVIIVDEFDRISHSKIKDEIKELGKKYKVICVVAKNEALKEEKINIFTLDDRNEARDIKSKAISDFVAKEFGETAFEHDENGAFGDIWYPLEFSDSDKFDFEDDAILLTFKEFPEKGIFTVRANGQFKGDSSQIKTFNINTATYKDILDFVTKVRPNVCHKDHMSDMTKNEALKEEKKVLTAEEKFDQDYINDVCYYLFHDPHYYELFDEWKKKADEIIKLYKEKHPKDEVMKKEKPDSVILYTQKCEEKLESLQEEKCPVCGDELDGKEPCEKCKKELEDKEELKESLLKEAKTMGKDAFEKRAKELGVKNMREEVEVDEAQCTVHKAVTHPDEDMKELKEAEDKKDNKIILDDSDAAVEQMLDSKEFQKPVSEQEVEAILDDNKEVEEACEHCEDKKEIKECGFKKLEALDEVDDCELEKCITESLTNVYENVDSFKLTDCELANDHIIVEGDITFKSGRVKPTKYIFTEAEVGPKTAILHGLNEDLDKDGKFILFCNLEDSGRNLIAERLNYNYHIGENLVEGLIETNK